MSDLKLGPELGISVKKGDSIEGGVFFINVPPLGAAGLLPAVLPLDSYVRDRILYATVRCESMWASALYVASSKLAAAAWDVIGDVPVRYRRAQKLLLGADVHSAGTGGWVQYIFKQFRDFATTNNGCFTEIVRATTAYASPIVAINHLSSLRCRRTGDPETPVIYTDRQGREILLKWYQVISHADMPDSDELLLGMGVCAAERAYRQIVKLAALESYFLDKVTGSRPTAIHLVNGLTRKQFDAIIADARHDAENTDSETMFRGFMGAIVATMIKPDGTPGVATIPLSEVPDGFEATSERDRADLIYADALGLDPQDIKPISNQQIGAGAQSQILADKAKGRGLEAFKQALTHGFNELLLDAKTKFVFSEIDYRDQQAAAEVVKAKVSNAVDLAGAQLVTTQEARQLLVDQKVLPTNFVQADLTLGGSLSDSDKLEVEAI